jgi:3-methyladenine DNA glycosylase AlkD
MEDWVKDISSWDVCDQVCMNLFDKNPLAWKKIIDWSGREEEFVKRAAFALIACLDVLLPTAIRFPISTSSNTSSIEPLKYLFY